MAAEDVIIPADTDVRELIDELDSIEGPEAVSSTELEALRKRLPTEPWLAKATEKALPFPWGEVFHYVESSDRQSAYWRSQPDLDRPKSEAHRKTREAFGEAARASEGIRGTVERGGREVQANAAVIADRVEGNRFAPKRVAESGRKALQRLRSLLRA